MKNKTLLLIFLSLLTIFLISQYAFEKKTRSFKTELIQLDTAKITTILVYPKSDNQEEIILKKERQNWIATKGNITTTANEGSVNSILRNVALIKTKRVAAKSPEKWKDFEVEETSGTRIKVFAGDKLLEDFIVGRFNFNQQTRQGISYVRLTKGDEVYAVDGFLSMTMGQGFDSYRNKQILKINKDQLTKISVNTQGLVSIFQKNSNQWTKNGSPIDSTKMATFLNGIQSVSGNTFADDFEELQSATLLYKTMSLEGNNIPSPILIKVYQDTTKTPPFIIHSSLNKDGYFESDENGAYKKLFGGLEQ